MRVNKIQTSNSANVNFGMARMSKSVERFISAAQKSCPPAQKANLEDAINIIKTSFPDAILTKARKKFHLIAEKTAGKARTISDYKYVTSLASIRDNKVDSVREIAGSLDFLKVGSFSNFCGISTARMDGTKADAFYKKWGEFFIGLKKV